jgi:predicted solute-binding protein
MNCVMAVTMHSEWTVSWLLPCTPNGLCHGCYHALRMDLCHGWYHALGMDCVMAVTMHSEWTDCAMAVTTHSEWTVSWLLPRPLNGLCHGCYHAL